MISLEEARKKVDAIENADGKSTKLTMITEYPDQYAFLYSYYDEDGNELEIEGPGYYAVKKRTGNVDRFFPPDYDEKYFKSGKNIPVK